MNHFMNKPGAFYAAQENLVDNNYFYKKKQKKKHKSEN